MAHGVSVLEAQVADCVCVRTLRCELMSLARFAFQACSFIRLRWRLKLTASYGEMSSGFSAARPGCQNPGVFWSNFAWHQDCKRARVVTGSLVAAANDLTQLAGFRMLDEG